MLVSVCRRPLVEVPGAERHALLENLPDDEKAMMRIAGHVMETLVSSLW